MFNKSAELTGLVAYLVKDNLLDASLATNALSTAESEHLSLTQYLIKMQLISSEDLLAYCAKTFNLPIYDGLQFDYRTESLLQSELIYRHRVLPLSRDSTSLKLALTDPTDHAMLNSINFQTGLNIRPVLIGENELDRILKQHYRQNGLGAQVESTLSKMLPINEPNIQHEIHDDDEPVTAFVAKLFTDAISKLASDIHIEPYESQCRIRFRCDGLLLEAAFIPPHLAARVITRLKIMANLNIAERRLPQDGRIQHTDNIKYDIRINTCPTLHGEKVVLRLLKTNNKQLTISALGMTEDQQKLLLDTLKSPQGLILVTGPTGSGKTLTLYAALEYLNQKEKNISSVEDPVEIELPGVNQININPKIDFDFANVLRALLRQDPDILMIGEIRDYETARIALQAAQTGHLVLSTLHTNSAAEAITRLQSMGIVNYQLLDSIVLVIAQRLIRKLCRHCKRADNHAVGCENCYSGYQGRTAIFEFIKITASIRELIQNNANALQIQCRAKDEGLTSLWEAGMTKIQQGLTTQAELIRVIPHLIPPDYTC